MNRFRPGRNNYSGARAFFIVILIFSIIAVWSALHGDDDAPSAAVGGGLRRRTADTIENSLGKRDQEQNPSLSSCW
ncbi:MAG: hypothetical protein LQ352_005709 [Teloschistes flavicans]|nr:MAG: hypothetical protein LQ352_005709 [Teloschistes flavicans]